MDQQTRIAELKRRAQELAGGAMIHKGVDELDPDLQEQFWSRVVAIESASRQSARSPPARRRQSGER